MNSAAQAPHSTARRSPPPRQRVWSLELFLVIGLPLAAVIGSFITLAVAMRSPVHVGAPLPEIDRFGRVITAEPVPTPENEKP